jgi:hypothetical protein
MASPTNREEFKTYCLRRLGWPVIEINVDDLQLEDRVDDALAFWREYHFDGTELIYLSHQITQADVDAKKIILGSTYDSTVLGITRMIRASGRTSGMFDIEYQFRLNDMATFSGGAYEMQNFWMVMSNLEMMQDILTPEPDILRWNRATNNLFIDWNWGSDAVVGEYIVLEAYTAVGEDNAEVWNDMFFKEYCTELFRQQWGQNLIKYEGLQLPGGITLNGRQMVDDANANLERLRLDVDLKWQLPLDFYVA